MHRRLLCVVLVFPVSACGRGGVMPRTGLACTCLCPVIFSVRVGGQIRGATASTVEGRPVLKAVHGLGSWHVCVPRQAQLFGLAFCGQVSHRICDCLLEVYIACEDLLSPYGVWALV